MGLDLGRGIGLMGVTEPLTSAPPWMPELEAIISRLQVIKQCDLLFLF